MPDLHTLLPFIATGLLLKLPPGPDLLFIAAHAMRAGARAPLPARVTRWLDGVAGALFIALGVRLAVGDAPGTR